MSKDVALFLFLGFLALIFGKNLENYGYYVAGSWGIAAFLWLRNYWLEYRNRRRWEKRHNKMEKERDEWVENFKKEHGRKPYLGECLDRIGAPTLDELKDGGFIE